MLGPEPPPEPRDLVDQMYCSEQIYIPPMFPYILKNWIKAAIRTQPYDLLKWSACYFRALAEHREPPVKDHMEYPVHDTPFHITPGFVRILAVQFEEEPEVPVEVLWKRWDGVCLPKEGFQRVLEIGQFEDEMIPTHIFIAVTCGLISRNLAASMVLFCESMTQEPEGGSASIPYELFKEAYTFLARLDNGLEPTPPSPVPSDLEIEIEVSKGKKKFEEKEIVEEYVPCPGTVGTQEVSSADDIGPLLSWSGSTLEPPEETMAERYCIEIVKELIGFALDVCEIRLNDGIVGMSDHLANYKMIYPLVENFLWIIFPEPTHSELSWTSTYTVTLGEEEEEEMPVKRHYHVPGIGPRISYAQIEKVLEFLKEWADRQEGMVLPRNLRHVLCPPLDAKPEEFDIANDTRGIRPRICPLEKCL